MQNLGNNEFLVLVVLAFTATLLLIESLYLLWRSSRGAEATRLKRRLASLAATRDRSGQSQLLKQRMLSELPAFERTLQRMPRMRHLDRMLQQSGLSWTVSGVLLAMVGCTVVGWTLADQLINFSGFLKPAMAAVAGSLPLLYVLRARSRRLATIERQLPDTLDLMTRALRAGHAFTAALKMAGEETAEPIAGEFRTVHDQMNFGVSMHQALTNLSERVQITDLRYFVVAVLIQRESGGNLTEILTGLSSLIRQRAKLLAKVKVLSSEGRLSAWILGLMPFALAFVLNLANPKFMSVLWTDPLGITIVKYMLVLMALGAVLMRKIVRIRV
ncbi:type II secretion system F family protein [Ramlibacter algicola]|uniref:Type II secretion system F family protein n=1 Tax=Ramlibacter algicola TaxID=2795217 RepID=A0A934USR8_9BURK|nr:type II secretion system F family protein [Ramlibacter algicola]MBK0394013.1 type II secretion system F family protein [Ramlibacter algicola]